MLMNYYQDDLNQLLDKIKKDNKLLVEEVVRNCISGNLQILGNLLKKAFRLKMETI